MVDESVFAALAGLSVTTSLPFLLYGAWIMIDAETVSWNVLTHHLWYIGTGLALTTVPIVGWMAPRLFRRLSGLAVIHAFLGLQAYALLAFALTGIVRIFQAKRGADLYDDPGGRDIDDLHENMAAWRGRLRIGVFGYVIFWGFAYVVGLDRYHGLYIP